MTIFVGSTNPVKINAVRVAASETWPEVTVVGYDTDSGVAAQPLTDAATRLGAENRAQAALTAGLAAHPEQANEVYLGVGLEGGVFDHANGELWSTVWVAVCDRHDHRFVANGARIKVPDKIAALMRAGGEMGPVVQQLTGQHDVRQKQGMLGVITNNFVDRTSEYGAIAKLALGLWYGREWDKDLI
ncbi:MAG TPA: inosine/xanthosine triphosphatase [Vitreimonas sp.]|nr:inosine/xanthosine triphosphatase [Vitreimonas sp.]